MATNPFLSNLYLHDLVITKESDPNIKVTQIQTSEGGQAIAEIETGTGPVQIYAPVPPAPGSTVDVVPIGSGTTTIARIYVDGVEKQIKTKSYDTDVAVINNKLDKKLEQTGISVIPVEFSPTAREEVAKVKICDNITPIYAPKKTLVGVKNIIEDEDRIQIAKITVDGNTTNIYSPGKTEELTWDNIKLDADFTFSGNYTLGVGKPSAETSVTFSAGTTLKNMFLAMFCGEYDPTPTKEEPTLQLVNCTSGTYNAGETITPIYEFNWNDGKYSYGPEPTGVSAIISIYYNDTPVASHSVSGDTTVTGSLNPITVAAGTDILIYRDLSSSNGNYAYKYDRHTASSVRIERKITGRELIGRIKGPTPTTVTYSYVGNNYSAEMNETFLTNIAESHPVSAGEDIKTKVLNIPEGTMRVTYALPGNYEFDKLYAIDGGLEVDITNESMFSAHTTTSITVNNITYTVVDYIANDKVLGLYQQIYKFTFK